MERVGFIPRLGAFLIDLGIFAVVVHLLVAADLVVNMTTNLNDFGILSLFGGGVMLVSYGFIEALTAITPGKRLAGLVIASADGEPPTRRALLTRWLTKNVAIFFAIPTCALWTLLSPYNYHVHLPDFLSAGVLVLAVVDTVLTTILLVTVVAGCFMAAKPDRQALHDALSGTAVFRRAEILAPRSFEPVVARAMHEGNNVR